MLAAEILTLVNSSAMPVAPCSSAASPRARASASDLYFSFRLVHRVRSGASVRQITRFNPTAGSGRAVYNRPGFALVLLRGGRAQTIMGP